jgi:phosphoribosylformimino-5-aminoimidazole carboxamide ribotide isomerase
VQGWTEDGLTAAELLRTWRMWPAAGLVYTDTTRDGLLAGPDLAGLQTCRELYGGAVIASGGIGSIDDITACAAAGAAGVVVGKALYEGRVELGAALRAAAAAAS